MVNIFYVRAKDTRRCLYKGYTGVSKRFNKHTSIPLILNYSTISIGEFSIYNLYLIFCLERCGKEYIMQLICLEIPINIPEVLLKFRNIAMLASAKY